MRHPATFTLTVLLDDQDPTLLRGRVCQVSTGTEITFKSAEELLSFLQSAANEEQAARRDQAQPTRGELELGDELA